MSNIRLRDIEGYKDFKSNITFFRCEDEYPGWTGIEKYIIISDIPEEELLNKYYLVMNAMHPYMILDSEFGSFQNDSKKKERSIQRFIDVHQTSYGFDENTEYCNEELIDYHSNELLDLRLDIDRAFENLTKLQRTRIIKYYFHGMTYDNIAQQEGTKKSTVFRSISIAREKIKKYFCDEC